MAPSRRKTALLSGVEALVRLPLIQADLDRRRGLSTAGFISGHGLPPLGALDVALWRAREELTQSRVELMPAFSAELAASTVSGSQGLPADPDRGIDGVFAMCYGVGLAAGPVIEGGNARGAARHGGVLVIQVRDPARPTGFDLQAQGPGVETSVPVLHAGSATECLELGLYGWALSRFSGSWVELELSSEVMESRAPVDLERLPTLFWVPPALLLPPGGLHYHGGDEPSRSGERRLSARLAAVRAFTRSNSVDRWICRTPRADLGIVTVGRAHHDFLEALRCLDLDLCDLAEAGIRVYKLGLVSPLEPTRLGQFLDGLSEVLVIEERRPSVERRIVAATWSAPGARPHVVGLDESPLPPATGEPRPSRIMVVFARWLAARRPALDRRERARQLSAWALLSSGRAALQLGGGPQ